jgi:hypothetical protein
MGKKYKKPLAKKKPKRESVFKESDRLMRENLGPFVIKGKKKKKIIRPWHRDSNLGFM